MARSPVSELLMHLGFVLLVHVLHIANQVEVTPQRGRIVRLGRTRFSGY